MNRDQVITETRRYLQRAIDDLQLCLTCGCNREEQQAKISWARATILLFVDRLISTCAWLKFGVLFSQIADCLRLAYCASLKDAQTLGFVHDCKSHLDAIISDSVHGQLYFVETTGGVS